MKGKFNTDDCIKSLRKKKDIKITEAENGAILILIDRSTSAKNDLGNGSYGKIDFLQKFNNCILKIKK